MKFRLVVSLCHFCELHGPAVLMSTQMMSLKSYNKLQKTFEQFSETINEEKTSCEGCLDFEKFNPGFVSIDSSSEKSPVYVSSLKTHEDELNKGIEHICDRSISCEQYPAQQGPIMYADEGCYCAFSYKFFLKDFHSRGFKRSYVVNVVCTDKFLLFNSWLYLVENLEVLVVQLRADAEKHFNQEHNIHSSAIRSRSPTKSPKSVQRGVRRERGFQGKQTRSVREMTNDQRLFERLHVTFVALLRGLCGRLVSAFAVERTVEVVGLEKQEDGAKEALEARDVQVFSHARVLMQVLGSHNFTDLLHHLLVGHQVLVRAKELAIITSIIECLKSLLPDQAVSLVTSFTTHYSAHQRRQLLVGMPLLPLLPPRLPPCLVLDVSGVHLLKKTRPLDSCWVSRRHRCEMEELLLRYYMLTMEGLQSVCEDESLLEAMKAVLVNRNLEDASVPSALNSLKQEWLHKARIYKACMRKEKQDEEKVLQVISAKYKDRELLRYWAHHYCL